MVESEAQSKFNITCLICRYQFTYSSTRSTFLAYYICDDCLESEKRHAEEFGATLLNNGMALPVSIGCVSANSSTYDRCKCQKHMDKERPTDFELLRKCWHDLHQNIQQIFHNDLNANTTLWTEKRFEVDEIRRSVTIETLLILAQKDQLYKQLENIGHVYVSNLKSNDLRQILLVPQVVPALIQLCEGDTTKEPIKHGRAKSFVETLLDCISCPEETVPNISSLTSVLDEDYLSHFDINGKIINHHIFDRVIYQDNPVSTYLLCSKISHKGRRIVHDDDENEEDRLQWAYNEAVLADILQGALQLVQSCHFFHSLMATSRGIFDKTSANTLLNQQKVINDIKLKSKDELLKDLNFFKNQGKMICSCIMRESPYRRWRANLSFGDLTEFIDSDCDNSESGTESVVALGGLHKLVEDGAAASLFISTHENGKALSCVRCRQCSVRHCCFDQCQISNISCGLFVDTSNLISPIIGCFHRDGDSERMQRKKSSPITKRLCGRNSRLHSSGVLFAVHDHQSQTETAWDNWQIPCGYADDIDHLRHCLCQKNMCNDFGSFNNRKGEEERATGNNDSFNILNGEKSQDIVKEKFGVMVKENRVDSSSICGFKDDDVQRISSVNGNEKSRRKHGLKSSFLMEKADLCSEGKADFTIASVSNINAKWFGLMKVGSNETGYGDVEFDYGISSPSLPGWEECMCNYHPSGLNGLLPKGIDRRRHAVLSKDGTVKDLALELFGQKVKGKPQMARKTGSAPPVLRMIRKNKVVPDKNGANNDGILAVKSLFGSTTSARERLLSEVKDMDKKVRMLRLVQICEDEHLTTRSSEDDKDRLLEKVRECLSKARMNEDEAVDLRAIFKDENCGLAPKIVQNSTTKTPYQEKRSDREMIYVPEARTVVTYSKASSDSACKKRMPSAKNVEQGCLPQRWTKQTLVAAISKQLIDRGSVSVEKKSAQTVSGKVSKHLDVTSNSTTGVEFSVDLGEFDIENFSEEVRKLHEEGKLKKILKQATGLKKKTGVSSKVNFKHDHGKRVENGYRVTVKELFGCQTDEDDEGTNEEWSDCEEDEQHSHHGHSCYKKTKNKRITAGTERDKWRGQCDCYYCEMFGHATTEGVKSGRAQVRERLRMKLKRRSVQESGTGTKNLEEKLVSNTANDKSKKSPAVIPETSIEEILDYINEKDVATAQATASKAAKRARQKLRKQEEKERQDKERKLKEERIKVTEVAHIKTEKKEVAQQKGNEEHQQEAKNEKQSNEEHQQEVKNEKQSKLETTKKLDRVKGKKQKNGRGRKKENEGRLSESQNFEIRKEPILEFEYWNDSSFGQESNRLKSTKEQIGTLKVGRARLHRNEESRKNGDVPKQSQLEKKRGNDEKNASAKKQAVEADAAVEKNQKKSRDPKSENAVKSGSTFSYNCATACSKTKDDESERVDLDFQQSRKFSLNKGSDFPSIAAKENETISPQTELRSQLPSRYVLKTSSVRLPSAISSPASSSTKPSVYGAAFSVHDLDVVSLKGSNTTTQKPLGVMNTPSQTNSCSRKATTQNFQITNTTPITQESTLSNFFPCRQELLSDVANPPSDKISDSFSAPARNLLDVSCSELGVGIEIQQVPQFINTAFPVSYRNDLMGCTVSMTKKAQPNKVVSDGVSLGSSPLTTAVCARRNEACEISSSSQLADYDMETRKLAGFVKEDENRNQNLMIFEPGDPRIAVAIAEIKADPHEAFKPRPDSELEFLDPFELEVEHFKRVLWEEQLARPRMSLRELRKIDPENEPNAVFHFAPLV